MRDRRSNGKTFIISASSPAGVQRQTTRYMMEKSACLPYKPEEHSDFLELTEDNLSKVTAVLPELLRQDRKRMRREEA